MATDDCTSPTNAAGSSTTNNNGLAPEGISDITLPSFTVRNCSGSRTGCIACVYTATKALCYIGVQSGILTASIALIWLLTRTTTYAAGILIFISLISTMRLSMVKTERITTICRFTQTLCVAIAAVGWACDDLLQPVGFTPLLLLCLAGIAVCAAIIHVFYFICTANGSGTHFRMAIVTMTLGALLGVSSIAVTVKSEILIGLGIACSIIVSQRDFGMILRDTCHYRLGRYSLMRTFTDLGRGANHNPVDFIVPNIEDVYEDKISSVKIFREHPTLIMAPLIGLTLTPPIWGYCHITKYGHDFQTPLTVVICVIVGHCLAFCLEPLMVYRRMYIPEVLVSFHGMAEITGIVLALLGVNFGTPLVLTLAISETLTCLLHLRKIILGAKRLAATYLCRGLHTGMYVTAGMCYLYSHM
ncbi:envelope protein UL43 [Felid alphaherpesvirus 1]|uniref:Envelope protein UL43 n=1 Tax=Feline herpesvirus 1 TaxID=10334 RepID=D1FXT9_FHV1|nr:envelope protein UL43 [Felid alphaherpesvirus 1]AMN88947.1 envelope protein UL43 [synthetic construct]ACT88315.1 envelope protein UL43 [Felid alphaherpesvirus 1]ALJ84090.1 envelope protein UL43 [Felid alphaherpesvirus 1]ALJ84166.1 envelope protein UL43 [Felid alphaherpesvirus 1]ALJ84242.1 envelope protein UL43 [Felid alphaherpesvirus 1]